MFIGIYGVIIPLKKIVANNKVRHIPTTLLSNRDCNGSPQEVATVKSPPGCPNFQSLNNKWPKLNRMVSKTKAGSLNNKAGF